jgi:tetratricopeptide (TPR) repeat protein
VEHTGSLDPLLEEAMGAFRKGALDQAKQLASSALKGDPDSAVANMLIGTITARTGDLAAAEPFFRAAAATDPEAYEPREWIAIILRETGRLDEAESASEDLVKRRPKSAAAHAALGLTYLKMRRPEEAASSFRRAAKLEPGSALHRRNLGVALSQAGKQEEALREYKASLGLAPNSVPSCLAIALIYSDWNRPEEAIPYLETAARLEPSSLVLAQLALALSGAGRDEEAELYTDKAIAADPRSAEALEAVAIRLLQVGRFEEAETTLRRAIAAEPERASLYFHVTRTRRARKSDSEFIERMEQMAAQANRDSEDLRQLHYAVAKSYDDLGEYESAIGHFQKANALAKRLQLGGRPYIAKATELYMDRAIGTFSTEFFTSHRDVGLESHMPVFIVGMVRSGTTLLEQIVSSHSQVAAAGELSFWTHGGAESAIAAILESRTEKADLRDLARSYLSVLERHAAGKPRVTDKMPLNYHTVGAMHLVLPNARFVHCLRNPADTCVSIYTTPFQGAPDFFYDIENIVDGYRQYRRIMAHWRATIPADRFYEVDYEDLVSNPQEVLPGLVEFLGLPWEESLLQHESNRHAISTPSSWQARQPLYSSSIDRWRRYEQWLGAFGDLIGS